MFSFKVHRSLIRLGLLPFHPPPRRSPSPLWPPGAHAGPAARDTRGSGAPHRLDRGLPLRAVPPETRPLLPCVCEAEEVGGGCQQRDRRPLAPPVHRPPAPVGPRRRAPDPSQTLGLFIVFDVVRRAKKGTQYQSRTTAGIDENHHFS